MPGRREPDEAAAAVGRVVVPVDQAVLLKVGDDIAHDRLGPLEVVAQLADRDRACEGKVLEDGPGRWGERRPLGVTSMEPQVYGRELPGEDFGGFVLIHLATLRIERSIVNPDGSCSGATVPFPALRPSSHREASP